MKRTVIITHATFAKGVYEAAKFIIGEAENVYVINSFTESEFPEKEFVELLETFDNNDKIVVLTDLKGGSVNQFVSRHIQDKNFYLVSGINLGTVIELLIKSEDDITDESIRAVVESGRKDLVFMNDEIKNFNDSTQNKDDDFFG